MFVVLLKEERAAFVLPAQTVRGCKVDNRRPHFVISLSKKEIRDHLCDASVCFPYIRALKIILVLVDWPDSMNY